jgi:hypothetical protein
VEAEPERPLADPPATWQEHWFDHRQLLRLYHSDEHCAIYADPGVRWAEVRWLSRFMNVTWQYSKATYGGVFGSDPRIYSIHHAGRHGGGHAGYYISRRVWEPTPGTTTGSSPYPTSVPHRGVPQGLEPPCVRGASRRLRTCLPSPMSWCLEALSEPGADGWVRCITIGCVVPIGGTATYLHTGAAGGNSFSIAVPMRGTARASRLLSDFYPMRTVSRTAPALSAGAVA